MVGVHVVATRVHFVATANMPEVDDACLLLCRGASWRLRPAQTSVRQHEGSADSKAKQTDSASEGIAERQHSAGTSSTYGEAGVHVDAASYPSSRSSVVGVEPSAGTLQQTAVGHGTDAACPHSSAEQHEPATAAPQVPSAPDASGCMPGHSSGSLQDEKPLGSDPANGLRSDSGLRPNLAALTAGNAVPAGLPACTN